MKKQHQQPVFDIVKQKESNSAFFSASGSTTLSGVSITSMTSQNSTW